MLICCYYYYGVGCHYHQNRWNHWNNYYGVGCHQNRLNHWNSQNENENEKEGQYKDQQNENENKNEEEEEDRVIAHFITITHLDLYHDQYIMIPA